MDTHLLEVEFGFESRGALASDQAWSNFEFNQSYMCYGGTSCRAPFIDSLALFSTQQTTTVQTTIMGRGGISTMAQVDKRGKKQEGKL